MVKWVITIATSALPRRPLTCMKRVRSGFLPPISLEAPGSPLHRQIYEWLRRAISDGRLRPRQAIPSTRALASDLGVSRIPVLTAYEELRAEGYLETFVGAGTRVAAAIPDNPVELGNGSLRGPVGRSAPRTVSRGVRALLAMPQDPPIRMTGAFRVSSPALDRSPSAIWSLLVRRHARNPSADQMAYGDPMGHEPFRAAIASYLGAARAVRCDASQIMVTAGSQQGLQICARTLLDPGDGVWIEEPGYPGAQRAFAFAGAELVPVPVDNRGLNVEEGIRRAPQARAAYITPSHQYPMGMAMDAARRLQLLAWSTRSGGWIIEDDYDSEYRFARRPIASLQGLDRDERVIYVGTFSKVLFPALRLGYLVIPQDLVPAFRATRDAADIFPPRLFQAALTDFMAEGHFARHIARMRMLYQERCATLVDAINARLGATLRIVNADAGMHLVGLLAPGVDDRLVARRAAAVGLSTIPLSNCCLETPPRRGLILGYGSSSPEQIQAGVARLADILAG